MTKPTAEPNARRPQPGRGEGMSQSGAEQSLIELSRIGEGKELDRYELQAVLRERIGVAALLAASSDDTLAQLAREQFEPEAPADTDAFCQEVLARLDEQRECQSPVPFVRQFVRRVLGFRVPPAQKRQELLDAALLDLARLEELIAFYENLQAVVSHMGGERPRGQEAAMHVDFYRRCLEERDAISRYVTSGVNDEAIRRSDDVDNFRSALSGVVSLFAEVPPYRLRHPRGEEHLDFKRINRWRHRVRTLPIGRGRDLGALYESGELRAFYQELAGERPGSTLFDIIHRSVQMVPKLEERRANFDELHELYDAGRWRGFYALALPQVEGLFGEMGEIAEPRRPGGPRARASLPSKVRFIRDYAEVHRQSLDYFEYLLPQERNRFSHTGRIDGEVELQATGVLFDLAFVCEVYTELTLPVIELLNLLANPEHDSGRDIRQLAHIFELATTIQEANRMDEVLGPFRAFLRRSLPDEAAKRATARELANALRRSASRMRESMRLTARERLAVEVDLGAERKTGEVVVNAAAIVGLVDELDALDRSFLLPLVLRTIMKGLLSHGELPADARKDVEGALASEYWTLRNLDEVMKLGR